MGFDPGTFVFVIRWGWPAVGPETTPFEPDLDDASVGNTDCLGDRRLFMVGTVVWAFQDDVEWW